jgi:hypothetical protein
MFILGPVSVAIGEGNGDGARVSVGRGGLGVMVTVGSADSAVRVSAALVSASRGAESAWRVSRRAGSRDGSTTGTCVGGGGTGVGAVAGAAQAANMPITSIEAINRKSVFTISSFGVLSWLGK